MAGTIEPPSLTIICHKCNTRLRIPPKVGLKDLNFAVVQLGWGINPYTCIDCLPRANKSTIPPKLITLARYNEKPKRRSAGEWVRLEPFAGFEPHASKLPAILQILTPKQNFKPCLWCKDPACRVWPEVITAPDPDNRNQRLRIFEVSECQMIDVDLSSEPIEIMKLASCTLCGGLEYMSCCVCDPNGCSRSNPNEICQLCNGTKRLPCEECWDAVYR